MVRVGRISFSGQSDLRTGNQQKNTPGRVEVLFWLSQVWCSITWFSAPSCVWPLFYMFSKKNKSSIHIHLHTDRTHA